MPAIVTIMAVRAGGEQPAFDDEFRMPLRASVWHRASGSGFVMSADGYILTSAHLVAGASETSVTDADQHRHRANIVGVDRLTDVAVLKIAATTLPVAPVGSSARLCPGEWVAAIDSPFGLENSLSAGVVSAFPRFLPGAYGVALIQVDVPLNTGSSGGPLFKARGEIVGMNSLGHTSKGGFSGVSFALPIDTVLKVAAELRSAGRVTRGQIGARTQAITAELAQAFGLDGDAGVLIVRVDPGGPAAVAGLRSGDVVLGVDGKPTMGYAEIQDRVAAARPANSLILSIWRHQTRSQ